MTQKDDIKSNVVKIQQGLKRLGAERVVALSVHKTKELVAELEVIAAHLAVQVEVD